MSQHCGKDIFSKNEKITDGSLPPLFWMLPDATFNETAKSL